MNLPSTREEYTQFALEYSNKDLYTEVLTQIRDEDGWDSENRLKAKQEIVSWIFETLDRFPDLVRVEYLEQFFSVKVYIANVGIKVFSVLVGNEYVERLLNHVQTQD